MSAIDLAEFKIDPGLLKLIPAAMAKKYMIIPLTRVGAKLTVAMADPSNVFAVDDTKFMTGYNVEVVIATESALINTITTYHGGKGEGLVTVKAQAQTQTPVQTTATAAEILQAKGLYPVRSMEALRMPLAQMKGLRLMLMSLIRLSAKRLAMLRL